MLEMYGQFLGSVSNALYSYILIILLVGGGIFFTLRTKFVQRLLGEAFRVIFLLSKTAAKVLDDYVAQRKAGKKPVFKASNVDLKEETDFWN